MLHDNSLYVAFMIKVTLAAILVIIAVLAFVAQW